MDFRSYCRVFTFFFSFFCASLPPLWAATGIALVHGTNNHESDAEGKYWKHTFINRLSNAMPEKDRVFVVHCDFSEYMWREESAGCLADQLIAFADKKSLDTLILYTHSNGANVARFILSYPSYDPRFMRVNDLVQEVIAIAPSSGGTPLADEVISGGVFEEGLGWLLGYRNNAVRQQREADMMLFNQEILLGSKGRLPLSKRFKVVVGTNVVASPLSSASYCNGYFLNSALRISKIFLDYCADGFLNCTSQEEAGEIWFRDYEKMDNKNTLSHNQSRHDCFGLEDVFIQHLTKIGAMV